MFERELRITDAKGMLARYTEDRRLDDREAGHLAALYASLGRLGWAPGQGPSRCVGTSQP